MSAIGESSIFEGQVANRSSAARQLPNAPEQHNRELLVQQSNMGAPALVCVSSTLSGRCSLMSTARN